MSKSRRGTINGLAISDLCGWRPDENRIADFAAKNPRLSLVAPHLLTRERKDVFLWLALLRCKPNWLRGNQGIGDCVSWGAELAATCLMALQACKGTAKFIAEAATEPIYGGCRVEALGKRSGGWSDGAFGAAAAKWLRDWGVILRVDMSSQTGNAEHDLRKYVSKRAKDWGNYGCGGQNDGGKLDGAARLMPVQHVVGVETIEEAAAAIQNCYPITIASNAGFGDMVRNDRGICRIVGEWAHQMCILGVRWRAGEPEFRIFQSWGPKSCSGSDPGIEQAAINGCSWWATAEDVAWILKTGDCWIYGDVFGLPPQNLDIVSPANRWYQPDRKPTHTLAV